MFENPTVADLTDFIVAQFSEGDDEVEGAVGGWPLCHDSTKHQVLQRSGASMHPCRSPGKAQQVAARLLALCS
eukprot:symbB.v1.2.003846.t1/scaffold213.1/size264521/1